MLKAHLAQADDHIALGEQHIAKQRNVIATLERLGVDTAFARQLLAEFERSLAIHIADRSRIARELAQRTDP